jgi:hypothetical protein
MLEGVIKLVLIELSFKKLRNAFECLHHKLVSRGHKLIVVIFYKITYETTGVQVPPTVLACCWPAGLLQCRASP